MTGFFKGFYFNNVPSNIQKKKFNSVFKVGEFLEGI